MERDSARSFDQSTSCLAYGCIWCAGLSIQYRKWCPPCQVIYRNATPQKQGMNIPSCMKNITKKWPLSCL
jgi:hypothetical protein